MDVFETHLEEPLKIKIIIVGDCGVGKSNIRTRFAQDKF
jgi:GTPase SAR1 family protein